MKHFVGTKIINAESMSELEFTNKIKNQDFPSGKENRSGYLVIYPGGYKSWSPKEVFEYAYREISVEEKELLGSEDFYPEKSPSEGESEGDLDDSSKSA